MNQMTELVSGSINTSTKPAAHAPGSPTYFLLQDSSQQQLTALAAATIANSNRQQSPQVININNSNNNSSVAGSAAVATVPLVYVVQPPPLRCRDRCYLVCWLVIVRHSAAVSLLGVLREPGGYVRHGAATGDFHYWHHSRDRRRRRALSGWLRASR
jgi:hypothetical protein